MADEYIRRQDAIAVLPQQISIRNSHMKGYVRGYNGCKFDAERAIKSLEPADVVPVEILKAEIYKLKCKQDSKNHDYYTGYMSALSTVEGILAEMDGED